MDVRSHHYKEVDSFLGVIDHTSSGFSASCAGKIRVVSQGPQAYTVEHQDLQRFTHKTSQAEMHGDLQPGDVLVRVLAVGICGSDWAQWAGSDFYYNEKNGRCAALLKEKGQLIPGHEILAQIVRIHKEVDGRSRYDLLSTQNIEEGQIVAVASHVSCPAKNGEQCVNCTLGNSHKCLDLRMMGQGVDGGLQPYMVVPEGCTMYPLPLAYNVLHYVLLEPLSVSLRAAGKVETAGKHVVVSGCGMIGMGVIVGLLSKGLAGVDGNGDGGGFPERITMLDVCDDKLRLMRELFLQKRFPGCTFHTFNTRQLLLSSLDGSAAQPELPQATYVSQAVKRALVETIQAVGEGTKFQRKTLEEEFHNGPDMFFECSGQHESINLGQELLRPCSVLVHLGICKQPMVSTNWNRISAQKELSIIGSSLGVGCWNDAVKLIAEGKICSCSKIIFPNALSCADYIELVSGSVDKRETSSSNNDEARMDYARNDINDGNKASESVHKSMNVLQNDRKSNPSGLKNIVSMYSPFMPYTSLPMIPGLMSRLLFGTLSLSQLSEEKAFELLDSVIFRYGCNTLECARIYGSGACEKIVGLYLESRKKKYPNLRNNLVIITKGGQKGRDGRFAACFGEQGALERDLEASLTALRVDAVDIYMLHRDDGVTDVAHVATLMTRVVRDGKARAWGVSNWSLARFQDLMEACKKDGSGLIKPVCVSPYFSLAHTSQRDRLYEHAVILGENHLAHATHAERMAEELMYYANNGVHVLCWAALAKGFFTHRRGGFAGNEVDYNRDMESDDFGADKEDDDDIAKFINASYRRLKTEDNYERLHRLDKLISIINNNNNKNNNNNSNNNAASRVNVTSLLVEYVLRTSIITHAIIGTRNVQHFAEAIPKYQLSKEEMNYLQFGNQEIQD